MRSNSNNKNIVCVVAHPDDEVLGLGGTLIKHVNCGDKVFIVILSEGEASKNNKNKKNPYRKDNPRLPTKEGEVSLWGQLSPMLEETWIEFYEMYVPD